jgi:polyhydroxybutyrate depolymerase
VTAEVRRAGRPRRHRRLRVVAAAALAAVAVVLTSCSGGSGGGKAGASGTPRGAASATPTSVSGRLGMLVAGPTPKVAVTPAANACTAARRQPPGRTLQAITSGGVRRVYMLDVPSGAANPKAKLPVIFAFHTSGQNGAEYDHYTNFGTTARQFGYVVVTPVGADNRWNFVRRATAGPDDVAFISALLDSLSGKVCVDENKVFAQGLADGADMAVTIACALPNRFAAVAVVAASVLPKPCGAPAPSMLEIHGTADADAPYAGGGRDRPAPLSGTTAQPVEGRLTLWALLVRCATKPVWTNVTAHTRLLSWPNCPGGRDVGLIAVTGGGHTWPGSAPAPSLGPTNEEFSANQVILLFFRGHALA